MILVPDIEKILSREINALRAPIKTCWTTPEHPRHRFVPKPHRVTGDADASQIRAVRGRGLTA